MTTEQHPDQELTDAPAPAPDDVPAAPADDGGPDPESDAEEATDGDDGDDGPDWAEIAAEDPRSKGEVLADLHDAETTRDEYLDDLRRSRAEFDNFRKRMMRQGASERDAGRADVAEKLLEVLDDFDRTLVAAEESDDDDLAKGVELVYGKLVDVLKALGLERIDDTGRPFDPNRHEAVQRVDADEDLDEAVVDEVLRPGYEMAGRVIRAAMVVVRQ